MYEPDTCCYALFSLTHQNDHLFHPKSKNPALRMQNGESEKEDAILVQDGLEKETF